MTIGILPATPPRPIDILQHEPTSALSEDTLEHAYAGVPAELVSCDCLCGGQIIVDGEPIAAAVKRHNDGPSHTEWAIANGWRDA